MVVHDPQGASGVREYIIAGTEIVSQRAVSRLAPSLTAADALGVEHIKSFHRSLRTWPNFMRSQRSSARGVGLSAAKRWNRCDPLWTVTCRNESGEPLERW